MLNSLVRSEWDYFRRNSLRWRIPIRERPMKKQLAHTKDLLATSDCCLMLLTEQNAARDRCSCLNIVVYDLEQSKQYTCVNTNVEEEANCVCSAEKRRKRIFLIVRKYRLWIVDKHGYNYFIPLSPPCHDLPLTLIAVWQSITQTKLGMFYGEV